MRTRIFLGLASSICAMILVIGCIFRSVHAGEGLPKETLGKEEQNLCEQLASETNETMLTEDEMQSIPEEAITEITIDPVAEGAVEETEQIIIYLEETKEEACDSTTEQVLVPEETSAARQEEEISSEATPEESAENTENKEVPIEENPIVETSTEKAQTETVEDAPATTTAATEEPAAVTEEPAAVTEEPAAVTEEPATATEESTAATEEPASASEEVPATEPETQAVAQTSKPEETAPAETVPSSEETNTEGEELHWYDVMTFEELKAANFWFNGRYIYPEERRLVTGIFANPINLLYDSCYARANEEQKKQLEAIHPELRRDEVGRYARLVLQAVGDIPADMPRLTIEQAIEICARYDWEQYRSEDYAILIVNSFDEVCGAADELPGWYGGIYYLDDEQTSYIKVWEWIVDYHDKDGNIWAVNDFTAQSYKLYGE